MAKKYDVVAVTGKYTDRDGKEKNRYQNIGVVLSGKSGFTIKIESVPIGWDGWAYLNEPKERDEKAPASRQSSSRAPTQEFADDIPF